MIETNGLSYQVFVTDFLLEKIKTNQTIKLFTYLQLRENTTIELYGFAEPSKLGYFKKLTEISGIGPKSAMNVLSLVRINDLEKAILDENAAILTKVSGIGKKTAERIILELKGKITKTVTGPIPQDDALIVDALVNMGYTLTEIRTAIRKIPNEILETKKRIKEILKILYGR